MDETYDVIVCGTGLTECILSGLLSQEGKKVLHIDRNPYYGDESASLNLTSLWKVFRPDQQPPQYLGTNRDWNIDLIPKFVVASGQLVKILLKTRVSRYLEWKVVDGTYVLQVKEGGMFSKGGPQLFKVPGNSSEALKSDLMGLFEKRRCKNFFSFVAKYDPSQYQAGQPRILEGINLEKTPFSALVAKFEIEPNTVDFIGHAVALYTNDDFLPRPAIETVEKIKLYMDSIGRYGDSPFIYPLYGLGGIPEGFSRLCAIYGGTFILNQDIDEILYEDGKVVGVRSGSNVAKCNLLIANPSYLLNTGHPNKLKQVGQVLRCICIMDHKILNTHKEAESLQIILPQRQTGRKSDIYIMMVSSVHQVTKAGFYLAIISAMVETNNPEKELELAFNLIGPVKEKFIKISPMYVANTDFSDNVFISNSSDPTSHFEAQTEDVLKLYKQITGKDLDLVNLPEDDEQ